MEVLINRCKIETDIKKTLNYNYIEFDCSDYNIEIKKNNNLNIIVSNRTYNSF